MRARALAVWWLALSSTAAADQVDVSLTNRAVRGQGHPAVHVHINEPIAGFRLKLQRDDGTAVDLKGGGSPGQTRTFDLAHPEGKVHWKGELQVNSPTGAVSSMPLEFDTEFYGPLSMKCDKEKDVDISNRTVRFTLTRPIGKVVLKVLMDTGAYAFDGDIAFEGQPAGTPLSVSWPQTPGNVMKVSVQPHDTSGFFTGIELSPWRVDIPHEEVNFEFGKWNLRPEEQGKLDHSYSLIADAVSKYGSLAEIRLFVAGCTDTVGSKVSNRTLSLNRARTIGSYFRRKGLRTPISYEGFGEDALAVLTADEVPEAKNRRALYIISIDEPAVQNTPIRAKWQRLE